MSHVKNTLSEIELKEARTKEIFDKFQKQVTNMHKMTVMTKLENALSVKKKARAKIGSMFCRQILA